MQPLNGHSRNPLVVKLSCFAPLSDDDIGLLETLCAEQERLQAGVDLVEEGNPARHGFVIIEGLACRYRIMPDGGRQILTFLLPGDFFGNHVFLMKAADHSIGTLAPTRLAWIEPARLIEIGEHPRIVAALWSNMMQEAAMLRERVCRLGRTNARARIAYLFCEFLWRYRAIGLNETHTMWLPLSQLDIADALGLTAVHVNRVLQDLRRDGLITMGHHQLTLHHFDQLQGIAQLDQNYLHLTGIPAAGERFLERLEPRKRA